MTDWEDLINWFKEADYASQSDIPAHVPNDIRDELMDILNEAEAAQREFEEPVEPEEPEEPEEPYEPYEEVSISERVHAFFVRIFGDDEEMEEEEEPEEPYEWEEE